MSLKSFTHAFDYQLWSLCICWSSKAIKNECTTSSAALKRCEGKSRSTSSDSAIEGVNHSPWDKYKTYWVIKWIVICAITVLSVLWATQASSNSYLHEAKVSRVMTLLSVLNALFNNMRTLKFKSQPTNAFFATVNQMFGGSSQLPNTAERAVIKWNRRVQFRRHSRKLGGAAERLIDGSEKRICRLSFEF